jgi:hypothetical protein
VDLEFSPTWCVVWQGDDGSYRTLWKWHKREAEACVNNHTGSLQPVVLHKRAVLPYIRLNGGEWDGICQPNILGD